MQSKKDVISKHKTYQFCDGRNDIDTFTILISHKVGPRYKLSFRCINDPA